MRNLLFAVLFMPMVSFAWDIGDLNKTVDQTNFIVDDRCSGTLISLEHRLILTANHCVEHKVRTYKEKEVVDGKIQEVEKVRLLDLPVTQKSYDGSRNIGSVEYMTEIVARDETKDLALLRIRDKSIPYTVESAFLPSGTELLRGQKVYSVGNPNLLDASVGTGVIASMNRMFRVRWANNEEIPFIQHDSSTTGGSSGGALYNNDGYLIGVHVAGYRGVPLGFAVHPDTIREFLDESCYPVYDGGVLANGTELRDTKEYVCNDWGGRGDIEDLPGVGANAVDGPDASVVREFWMEKLGFQEVAEKEAE